MKTKVIDPMTVLLDTLKERGIDVRASGDHLKIDAPPGALTNELRDRLRALKADLLAAACDICGSVQLYAFGSDGQPLCEQHGAGPQCGLCGSEASPVGMTICVHCAVSALVEHAEQGAA